MLPIVKNKRPHKMRSLNHALSSRAIALPDCWFRSLPRCTLNPYDRFSFVRFERNQKRKSQIKTSWKSTKEKLIVFAFCLLYQTLYSFFLFILILCASLRRPRNIK